jgi:hypothetical protein
MNAGKGTSHRLCGLFFLLISVLNKMTAGFSLMEGKVAKLGCLSDNL